MRSFSKKELARYNGKKGTPVYIAYKGKVYDASNSYQWKTGRHQVVHYAGEDLTGALRQAPHGADMLDRLPMVGTLNDD